MKKIFQIVVFCGPLFIAPALADETGERDAVLTMVQGFFDAMTDRDVERMKSMLTHDGILYGYREGPDGLSILRRPHQAFIEGLAEGDSKVIERFWEPQILLHGRMAAVWTPYDLYVDGEFSHCGIDNFSLMKTDQGWMITGVVFSMEPDNCAASPLGPLQD